MWKQLRSLIKNGGILVCSPEDQRDSEEIYARTLIQIDGDVTNTFVRTAAERTDLIAAHFQRVCEQIRRLKSFRVTLRRVSHGLIGGAVGLEIIPGLKIIVAGSFDNISGLILHKYSVFAVMTFALKLVLPLIARTLVTAGRSKFPGWAGSVFPIDPTRLH